MPSIPLYTVDGGLLMTVFFILFSRNVKANSKTVVGSANVTVHRTGLYFQFTRLGAQFEYAIFDIQKYKPKTASTKKNQEDRHQLLSMCIV